MKTLNTVLKKTVIASLLLTSMTAFAADDSGDGRSGDDQAGVSIPVQIDHQLTERKLLNSYKNCKQKEMLDVLSQLLRIDLNNEIKQQGKDALVIKTETESGIEFLILELESINTVMTDGRFSIYITPGMLAQSNANRLPTYTVSSNIFNLFKRASADVTIRLNGGSYLKYSIDENASYDELGNKTVDTRIVNTVELITEKDFYRRGHGILTPIKLAATASREDFKQCLEEQLAR